MELGTDPEGGWRLEELEGRNKINHLCGMKERERHKEAGGGLWISLSVCMCVCVSDNTYREAVLESWDSEVVAVVMDVLRWGSV